jgi:hypothetical protein
MVRIAITLLLILSPAAAFADKEAAAACAAGLQPQSRAIFDATLAKLGAGTGEKPGEILKAETIALVKAGTLPQDGAKTAAQEAGACLKMFKQ